MITKSKQDWQAGATVKVGFLTLTVIAAIPTPGDYAPDAYVLARGEQFYSFVPHNGLNKIDASEARSMVEEAAAFRRAAETKAAIQAVAAINAAKVRDELMALAA